MSQNYVFDNKNGKLEFIGDFEGLYQNENDPWGQSGSGTHLDSYYKVARKNLIDYVNELVDAYNGCEIGCGLGYVTNLLNVQSNKIFDGIDISQTAITKAKQEFPDIEFFIGDISSEKLNSKKKYDIVILNQILWYILHDIDQVFININQMLNSGGYLIISMLFLEKYEYGRETIGSFDDLIFYCLNNEDLKCKFVKGFIDYSDTSETVKYRESILVVQKYVSD
jgi:SAM-dependent methyltransferase